MKIDVLGLGESLQEFKPSSNIIIGVNDINKHHCVDYLVIVDKPEKFTEDRLDTILCSHPQKFYTHLDEWEKLVGNYQKINLALGRGNISNIESQDVCYSNNSTYVAVVIAYKKGATQINIFGADFNNHPNFREGSGLNSTLKDFKQLFDYLKSKGVEVNVSNGSRLKELI